MKKELMDLFKEYSEKVESVVNQEVNEEELFEEVLPAGTVVKSKFSGKPYVLIGRLKEKDCETFGKAYSIDAGREGMWIGDKQRKRRLPDAKGDTRRYNPKRNRAMRQAPNARIQGLAAMQTKATTIRLYEECQRRGWRLLLNIHDEVGILMPENSTESDFRKFNEIMTQTYLVDGVENGTDIEIQKRWGDSVSLDAFLAGERPKL